MGGRWKIDWRSVRVLAAVSMILIFGSACRLVVAADSAAKTQASGGRKTDDFGYPEVTLIDEAIRKGWIDHDLVPSKAATDGEWCRRVYLDVLGREENTRSPSGRSL